MTPVLGGVGSPVGIGEPWVPTEPMPEGSARRQHAAQLLSTSCANDCGKVVGAGGSGDPGVPTSTLMFSETGKAPGLR